MEYFDRAGFPKHSNLQTCYSSVAIIFTFLSENSPLDSWRHLISYMIFCLFHWFEKWARPEGAKISHMPLDYPDTQKPESLNLWCLKLNHSISILYLIFTVICQGHTESLQSWEQDLACSWFKPKDSCTFTNAISTVSYPHNLQNKDRMHLHAQDIGCEKHRKDLKDPKSHCTSLQELTQAPQLAFHH